MTIGDLGPRWCEINSFVSEEKKIKIEKSENDEEVDNPDEIEIEDSDEDEKKVKKEEKTEWDQELCFMRKNLIFIFLKFFS